MCIRDSPSSSLAIPTLKKIDLGLRFNKFRDRPTPSLSDDGHGRALRAAAARAATLEDSTPTRTHAHHTHRRGLLYLRREAHGPRTDRPCVPLASDVPGTQTANQILSSNLEESRTTLEE